MSREPVTASGWYRHTESTWRYYGWGNGILTEGTTVCTADLDRYKELEGVWSDGLVAHPTEVESERAAAAERELADIVRRGRVTASAEEA